MLRTQLLCVRDTPSEERHKVSEFIVPSFYKAPYSCPLPLYLIIPTSFLQRSYSRSAMPFGFTDGLTTFLVCTCACLSCFIDVQLFVTLWTVACQAPLSMRFCRQEYWSRLPWLPSGLLPDPGIEPTSLASPALTDGFSTPPVPPGKLPSGNCLCNTVSQ